MDEKPGILIVEDDVAVRRMLTDVLGHFGYACEAASCCAEARDAVRRNRFACGLLDLGLPDGNGLRLVADFKEVDPCMVQVILTGDGSAETIIDTMRAGAFDYLTKPVDATTLKAAVARAVAHQEVVQERGELVQLLLREREQLKSRVEAATADIRQYAASCEASNTRLSALLRLTQVASGFYTDESLLRGVFGELVKHLPLQCVALCDVSRQQFLAALTGENNRVTVIASGGDGSRMGLDSLLAAAEPGLFVQSWVERYTGLDTRGLASFVYPQTFWQRTVCTIGFFLDPEFAGGEAEKEFFGMCAHFIAFEWQQARLLLHAAHESSLGSIAVELSKSFMQCLTAIRATADVMTETVVSPEASEGLKIIRDNVELLRMQTQEFRKLSLHREDCIETVRLDEFVEQALDMLAVTVRNRRIRVEKEFQEDCECVLMNGTALARTFLDLISSAVRGVELGGRVLLCLQDAAPEYIAFEVSHHGRTPEDTPGVANAAYGEPGPEMAMDHPKLQLAQRTVHSCGGKLTSERDQDGHSTFRIVLPRNATNPSPVPEVIR